MAFFPYQKYLFIYFFFFFFFQLDVVSAESLGTNVPSALREWNLPGKGNLRKLSIILF